MAQRGNHSCNIIRLGAFALAAIVVPCAAFAQDADGDGYPDVADAFPCDPSASGERYAPAEGVHGTLAFEDQWPSDGDLDFNDVVVTYNYAALTVGNGLVRELRATFNVRAAGGGNSNGLGLHLPVPRTAVGFVTRRVGNGPVESVTRSPTDAEADIVVVPNIRALFADTAEPINSRSDLPARTSVPVEITMTLFTPTAINFASAPFDLYIFRVGTPSLEIHRPGYRGTSRMNTALFGTVNDATNAVTAFVNRSGLPFALMVPDGWAWPREATSIDQAYPQVVGFAASGGFSNLTWYTTFNTPAVYGAPSGSSLSAPTFISGPRWPVDRSCLCRVSQARVFTYTGAPQLWSVPLGVTRIAVKAWGAAGGGSNAEGRQFPGGPGALVTGELDVTPGQAFWVIVGQGGRLSSSGAVSAYPAGGAPSTRAGYVMGGGGGRTALSFDTNELAMVAGGGGGAGGTGWNSPLSTAGGAGGGPDGADGSYATDGADRSACRGRGGTQSAGGAGGSCGPTGGNGYHLGGGAGRDFAAGGNAGGGGGDGYYGGGAGAMHAGGGGGSSYTYRVFGATYAASASGALPPGTTDVDYVAGVGAGAPGAVGGDGRVVIRFTGPCSCVQPLATFAATGAAQTFTVPAGVEMVRAAVWGAGGGGSNAEGRQFPGGPGGFASGVVDVTPGETLTVLVGRGGGRTSVAGAASAYPNGGRAGLRAGYSMGNGGGRSAIVRAGSEVMVAGGGGGAGGTGWSSAQSTRGGGGGGSAGGDGSFATDGNDRSACRGRGATQTGGGAGGNCGAYGGAGGRNVGGDGLHFGAGGNAGGGGGDGYWGGGAGGMHAGGGGGAGFVQASVLDGFLASPSLTSVAPSISEPGYPGGRVGEGAADMDGGPGAVVLWSYAEGACP